MTKPNSDDQAQASRQSLKFNLIALGWIASLPLGSSYLLYLKSRTAQGLAAAHPWNLAPPAGTLDILMILVGAFFLASGSSLPRSNLSNARAKMASGKPVDPNHPDRSSEAELRSLYGDWMIRPMMMYWAIALSNMVSFMARGKYPNLVVALILFGGMVLWYLTRGSMTAFVDEQTRLLSQTPQSS